MPNYNYLKQDETDFPHIGNINVYKYDNTFDYGRFDAPQMELMICTVPWDVGEAHVGQRTISGIGNVVYFETKAKRDKWFADIPDSECYRFTTKYKELHRSMEIDVPIPYDMCAKHNYLVVKYAKFANENSPVQYEGSDGLREWFWFIREVEFVAPNTTRLHLLDDAFQTWIYDVTIGGMILERGHAPMFATKAATYLTNPIANNANLLTDDVNYGEATQVATIEAVCMNAGNMYACFATTAAPTGTWGSKANNDWKVPCHTSYTTDGLPSVYVFAVAAANFSSFLANIDASYPQFKQTVQAVFLVSDDLITLGTKFSFASIDCYPLTASRKSFDLTVLTKTQFGYGANYADIAKLYTSPYAHLEICDENGSTDIIKIEDTSGNIDVSAALSIAYPFITIEAHLSGVGGSGSKSITFKNLTSKTITLDGNWYETLHTWQVPTFAVVLNPTSENDYATHFDRAQQVVDYTAAYDNAIASADTDTANTDLVNTANTATTTRSNTSANDALSYTQTYNSGLNTASNMIIDFTATSTIAANEQQAAVSAMGAVGTSAVTAIASANPVSAAASIGNGIISAATTMGQCEITNGLTATNAYYAKAGNDANAQASNTKSSWDTSNQTSTASDLTTIQNTMNTGTTANSVATQKANALRNKNAAQSAIDNSISQAALRQPFMYGSFANGDSATTKPMALFCHIVTQSKAAIECAGDEFLRYGYMLDKQWAFDGNWNVGKYFTYWKLRDFWVKNLNVPDLYMDKLRFFLFGGVTVWRKPEDIGNVTIYENFNS